MKSFLSFRNLLTHGGNMQRFLTAMFITLVMLGFASETKAQYIVDVSGFLLPGQQRIFHYRTQNNAQTDTIYRISGDYHISGTLIIQEGAEVHFLPGSRMIDSAGGTIQANGCAAIQGDPNPARRILFRGFNINSNSYEWGQIVILPGAKQALFANCRFTFFNKKESIDNQPVYGITTGAQLNSSRALMAASNGTGGVMTTFCANTYLYDIIVDSCTALYRGGAFAFLKTPSTAPLPNMFAPMYGTGGNGGNATAVIDDGRLALDNTHRQVRKLIIRDTRVLNTTAVHNASALWSDTSACGGAIFMSSEAGGTTADWVAGYLGYTSDVRYPNPLTYVSNILITNSGSGYSSSPTVTITGGGGSGAQAIATVNTATGTITGITITNPGLGYTSTPIITLTGGGGSGAAAISFITTCPMPQDKDTMHFERCTANNAGSSGTTSGTTALGGAIYVGPFTGLTTALIGCYSDSAINTSSSTSPALDQERKGGAIFVSKFSADPSWLPPPAITSRNPGLAVLHRGTFKGNVAGLGGAIYSDWQGNVNTTTAGSSLNIDGDYGTLDSARRAGVFPIFRDSGIIQFLSNTAYVKGGAIYQNWYTYITGYLAPNTNFPMRFDSVELRVRFQDNAAGIGGGSVYLNPDGNPDYQIRRAWHLANFVDPLNPRINRAAYSMIVLGGGAEFLGTRDSTFAVEYNRNYVINGNGGAVYMNMGQSGPGAFGYNRFMVENTYNALNPSFGNGIGVTGFTITNGGSGYASIPTITLSGGGGSGAFAWPTMVAGSVVAINVIMPGLGYTSAPLVTISGGGGSGAAATASIGDVVPMPYDPRELTRFCMNYVNLRNANDSLATFNRNGRGGAIYVTINNSISPLGGAADSLLLSRVRAEENQAFTGSAIHSDNYRLNVNANQTLIANNFATSLHSATVDLDSLPSNPGDPNAGATIWADFEGPQPQWNSNARGNAIYDNRARFILRLPNGPHGFGGVDTMRGNFWGETGPDIITKLPTLPVGAIQRTFFLDYYTKGCYKNVYEPNRFPPSGYTPDLIGTIPDTLLMEGRIYDIFDKGLDIKTADYTPRRLAITEAFSLGLPTDIGLASSGHVGLHRWTRDIFEKDSIYLTKIMQYQAQFQGPHPIGYPLFLSADIDASDINRDHCARNYTTVFVFDETTQEYVRVNLKEETVDGKGNGLDSVTLPYKGRLDFVPDSTVAQRHPALRARVFWSPSLIRPSNNTYPEIVRASTLEDSAALDGRAYNLGVSDITNMTAADSVCAEGITSQTTWYAGERYHTLPVRPGDVIDVFSRTQLWKYGFAGAKARGLTFTIGDVLPPFFAGDVGKLQNDTVNPNRLFLREDNDYLPGDAATTGGAAFTRYVIHSTGNSQGYAVTDDQYPTTTNPASPVNGILFRIGGYDVNQFYDPRFLFDPFYPMLDFSVTFANMDSINYRLPWWLQRDTVRNVNPSGGSNGYIQLFGTPHNPDVVPGGEPVHVVMTNYPPNFYSEHLLLGGPIVDPVTGQTVPAFATGHSIPFASLGNAPDTLSMWIFPAYMNCPQGFLADTLCVRRTSSTYDFSIFVQDSLPRFLDSVTAGCDGVANLSDSLRFDFDINTDDEIEDSVALARSIAASNVPGSMLNGATNPYTNATYAGWDFRYGRTSYKGLVVPSWMKGAINDPIFKTKGIVHIGIPAATALQMITPTPQVNGELLLDTIAAIQADDGHAGLKTLRWRASINVAPFILAKGLDAKHTGNTQVLPHAKEDFDYSTYTKDTSFVVRINFNDPNFGDTHTFHLVYQGTTEVAYVDNRYKAGQTTLVGTTPKWLQINPISGALSGVPGLADAPHSDNNPECGGPDTVLVVVSDQCGLEDWAWIPINVDSTNHPPHFTRGPQLRCVTNKVQFCDTIIVIDKDLARPMCADSLSFTLVNPPANFSGTLTPMDTTGKTHNPASVALTNDTVKLSLCGTFTIDQTSGFFNNPQPQIIQIAVNDNSYGNSNPLQGNADTLTYKIYVGDVPTFECAVTVYNKFDATQHDQSDMQRLCFGAARFATDSLDQRYCEFEVPPQPVASAFDARWELPVGGTLKGSLIDVRSDAITKNDIVTWQIRFNAGSDNGAYLFPVRICWAISCLDNAVKNLPGNFYLIHESNPKEYGILMNNNGSTPAGSGTINPASYKVTKIGSDSLCLEIFDVAQKGARIVFIPQGSGVSDAPAKTFSVENAPNPFTSWTKITLGIAERSAVRLEIYDLKGLLVKTLVANEMIDAGEYPVVWDGTDKNGEVVPSGTYICKMTAGEFSQTLKMTVAR